MKLTANCPQIRMLEHTYHHITDWSGAMPLRGNWRMWWNETSGAAISHRRRRYAIDSDRVVVVPPNTPIQHILSHPVNSLCFQFTLGLPYDAFAGRIIDFPLSADASSAMTELCHAMRREGQSAAVSIEHSMWIYGLILLALSSVPDQRWPAFPQNHYVSRAVLLMEESLSHQLTNPEIARQLGLGTNTFLRIFREAMGVSPQKYLQHRRLDLASIELIHTNDSIESVAARCGFCDRHYFSRQFRARYSVGPATYRRMQF